MTIKAVEVKIRRSELTEPVAIYSVWELPILEAAHIQVTVLRELEISRTPPDAQDEYTRLENRYGRTVNEDGSRGLPYVAAIYGQFNAGVQKLADAIKHATVEDTGDQSDLMGVA